MNKRIRCGFILDLSFRDVLASEEVELFTKNIESNKHLQSTGEKLKVTVTVLAFKDCEEVPVPVNVKDELRDMANFHGVRIRFSKVKGKNGN